MGLVASPILGISEAGAVVGTLGLILARRQTSAKISIFRFDLIKGGLVPGPFLFVVAPCTRHVGMVGPVGDFLHLLGKPLVKLADSILKLIT
jgi:hypothetical protein